MTVWKIKYSKKLNRYIVVPLKKGIVAHKRMGNFYQDYESANLKADKINLYSNHSFCRLKYERNDYNRV